MGLSSFNAMRARKRAMEQANVKSEPTPIEVKEVDNSSISNETETEELESVDIVEPPEERKKKTDAEKLKKKE